MTTVEDLCDELQAAKAARLEALLYLHSARIKGGGITTLIQDLITILQKG